MGIPVSRIVLVGPKTPGNVGAVARVMSNFGLDDLVLVDPCELTDAAFVRATNGRHVLEGAKELETFEEAVKGYFVIGTTGFKATKQKIYHRVNLRPDELLEPIERTDLPEAKSPLRREPQHRKAG